MAEVFSPQVVVREVDVSTVAPSVSTAIAAIVGGATKGPVNTPKFISTPDAFVETFGSPVTNSFLGLTAINFLRKGNQLWVNRVASLAGSDPVATANTNGRAVITTPDITSFSVTGSLKILFDGGEVIINFSPVTSANISTMVNTINTFLSNSSPKKGTASVYNGTKIRIESQSKNGPLSTIAVSYTDLPEFSGLSDSGERTVLTSQALTAASVTSTNSSATIDTTVVYANIEGNTAATEAVGTLYNVSSEIQEAYGVLSIDANNFVAGVYNSATLEITSLPVAGNTITFDRSDTGVGVDVSFIWDTDITIGATTQASASNLANYINTYPSMIVGTLNGNGRFPATGVRASAAGNIVTLRQIHPDSAVTVTIDGTGTWGTLNGSTPIATGAPTGSGTTGSYIRINIPSAYAAPSYTEEDNVDYYFMASADFTITGTLSTIASSLATAVGTVFQGYVTADDYTLTASSNSNQVTIASALDAGSTGGATGTTTGIAIVLDDESGSSITVEDLGGLPATINGAAVTDGGTLQHGFDARSTYLFGTLTVDGSPYVIDFDTVPVSVLPDVHESTLTEVATAINYVIEENVASVNESGGFEHLVVTSPTPGAEGTLTATNSSNIGGQNDPLVDHTTTLGTGDNRLVFKIDDSLEVEVELTQDSALTLAQAVAEINAAATAVDSSLSGVASESGTAITLTTPTLGTFADFGSAVQVTNALDGVFDDLTMHEGTGSKNESITLAATSPGTWANGAIKVSFSDEDPLFSVANSSKVDVLFNGVIVESFRQVVINPDADGTVGVSGQGTYIERAINGVSEFITVDFDDSLIDTDPDTLSTSVKIIPNTSSLGSLPPYELSGGNDGINGLTDGDVIGVPRDTTTGRPTGLQVFANTETIFINLIAAPGFTSQAVGNALVSLAENRQDTLAFIDPPVGLEASEVVDWHNGQGFGRTAALNTSYAALYNTWLSQFDPYNNVNMLVPPSTFLLAQTAFNDSVAEPWIATAGLTRGRLTDALDVVSPTTLGDRELIYGQGNRVNPIPKFVQDGIVVWGNRTLYRQESALKEITVRRMLNYAKVVISLAAKVILFEPNDPTTSTRLLEIINPALYSIRVRRGLVDFKVVDATTNRDRNLNRLVIKIFLQPTRTVEVIEIPFIITAAGGSFAI